MIDRGTGLALIAAGIGFLYFGGLFSATGIFVGGRGWAVTAAEDPEKFSYALGGLLLAGGASLIGGLVALLRPPR